jgi:hypothetical protein
MVFWYIKIIIFSILLIYLIHNIIAFLFETMTVPTKKDMIQITNKNYENMFKTLSKNAENNENTENKNLEVTPIDSLPNNENDKLLQSDEMKNELINYLRQQTN